MKKCIWIAVLFISTCFNIYAQQPYIDLLGVEYYRLPAGTSYSGDNKLTTSWFKASIQAPIKIKEDYLIIQPSYEQYTFDKSVTFPGNLYGISLPLTYIRQWNNKQWQTAFVVIPRISAELQPVPEDGYQLGGAVVAIYKKRQDLDYKFGVYYNSEFFGPFIIPLAGIDWKINDRFTLFGLLPLSLNLEYKLGKNIYAGVAIYTVTNSYRLSNHDWIKIADNHLKLFLNYYISGNLVLISEAGFSILRKYTYGSGYGNNDIEINLQYKDGPIFKVGIAWRIRLDEAKAN